MLGLVFSAVAGARTMYVSDQLQIQMRSGKSTSHRIFASLRSGDVVTVIEEDSASGYSLVRSSGGKEGWVVSRYLMSKPSARSQLMKMQEKVDSLSANYAKVLEENKAQKKEIKELKALKSSLTRTKMELETEVQELKTTYAGEMSFQTKYKKAVKAHDDIQIQMNGVKDENNKLRSKSDQLWVLAGGGILFLGIIFGLLIPKIRWQKRSSWSSL